MLQIEQYIHGHQRSFQAFFTRHTSVSLENIPSYLSSQNHHTSGQVLDVRSLLRRWSSAACRWQTHEDLEAVVDTPFCTQRQPNFPSSLSPTELLT